VLAFSAVRAVITDSTPTTFDRTCLTIRLPSRSNFKSAFVDSLTHVTSLLGTDR
jgi:hypothetical protein